ncbi:hypothetical protein DID88_003198 [Monilinia fructigena]|uniref:Coatomer subunit epsilon n=1 Tax=Monilinia fructigena TaxID=38457 RepID=A0A395IUM7_9HELO|nr:hypothetical protein DID88_003198 [Monilinia fructigena]
MRCLDSDKYVDEKRTDEEDGEDSEEDYEEVNEKVKEMVNEKLNENVHEEVKGIESKFKLPFKDSTDEKVKSRPLRLVSERSFPRECTPSARCILRAQIALGQSEDVLADVQGEDDVELKAVGALAILANGDEDKAVEIVTKLAEGSSDNVVVQVLGGTVLQAAGKSEEALQLLALHQGNLEAVALIVQIHLEQNRTDLAIKEVQQARRWAQDSLLVNLAESWVGLRVGGEKYQQAFYVFEELAQAPSTSFNSESCRTSYRRNSSGKIRGSRSSIRTSFQQGSRKCRGSGKQISLGNTSPEHAFLKDLEEKSSLFDKAATKYSAKVA